MKIAFMNAPKTLLQYEINLIYQRINRTATPQLCLTTQKMMSTFIGSPNACLITSKPQQSTAQMMSKTVRK